MATMAGSMLEVLLPLVASSSIRPPPYQGSRGTKTAWWWRTMARLLRCASFRRDLFASEVATLVPKSELNGEMGDACGTLQARLMIQALHKLCHSLFQSQTILLFINQVRSKVNTFIEFGGPTEVISGGNTLKFYASVHLNIKRSSLV